MHTKNSWPTQHTEEPFTQPAARFWVHCKHHVGTSEHQSSNIEIPIQRGNSLSVFNHDLIYWGLVHLFNLVILTSTNGVTLSWLRHHLHCAARPVVSWWFNIWGAVNYDSTTERSIQLPLISHLHPHSWDVFMRPAVPIKYPPWCAYFKKIKTIITISELIFLQFTWQKRRVLWSLKSNVLLSAFDMIKLQASDSGL